MGIENETSGSRQPFYKPLDVQRYEIRMLRILPGAPDSIVKCALETTNLIGPIRYTALSYCWGDPKVTSTIMVNDVEVQVTINLADALYQLRLFDVSWIWVDAICINQGDNQEKSLQIRNMKHIYSKADEVFAWVGKEEEDDSAKAMQLLDALSLGPGTLVYDLLLNSDPTILDPTTDDTVPLVSLPKSAGAITIPDNDELPPQLKTSFNGIRDLFGRPYWKRLWIIQEIAVATRVSIVCGHSRINLDNMRKAVQVCGSSRFWDKEMWDSVEYFTRIVNIRSFLGGNGMSLAQAMSMSARSLSTDPRDRIFAMLGLARDGLELVPIPNYEQSLDNILTEMAKIMITKKRSLNMILVNSNLKARSISLPSWAPDFSCPEISEYKKLDETVFSCFMVNNTLASRIKFQDGNLRVDGVKMGIVKYVAKPDTSHAHVVGIENRSRLPGKQLDAFRVKPYYRSRSAKIRAIFDCLATMFPGSSATPKVQLLKPTLQILLSDLNSRKWKSQFFARQINRFGFTFDFDWVHCEEKSSFPTPEHRLSTWLDLNSKTIVCGASVKYWSRSRSLLDNFLRCLRSPQIVFLVCLLTFCVAIAAVTYSAGAAGKLWGQAILQFSGSIGPYFLLAIFFVVACTVCGVAMGCLLFVVEHHQRLQVWLNHLAYYFDDENELFESDKGFIGTARGVESGDHICLLPACQFPVVLRPSTSGGRVQYSVVSKAFLSLSAADIKRQKGFFQEGNPTNFIAPDTRKDWAQKCQLNGTLEEFELI